MAPETSALVELAGGYLARQAWFEAVTKHDGDAPVEAIAVDVLSNQRPGLARVLLGRGERVFQLFIGWRTSQELIGALHEETMSICGTAREGDEQVICYDALADDALTRFLLSLVSEGREHASSVRLVASLVSHASLVYDERLFMKCYRVIEPGDRAEAEVLFGLDEVGFNALLAPVARWRAHGYDLALVREFLPNALEGRALALTSLRDLLGHGASEAESEERLRALSGTEPADRAAASAGGDFASEMARLGQTTGRLHLAMQLAFGDEVIGDEAIGAERDLGRSIRLHGDYHLRRVMRSETGWLVTGFGDDPTYADSDAAVVVPPRSGSPLEDVADMFFSLAEVAREARLQRTSVQVELASVLSEAWIRRNRRSFLAGYLETPGIDALLPTSTEQREQLLETFESARRARYEARPALG